MNYRGSTGFGRDSIDALTGSIGTKDVADVVACTRDVIDSMTWASLGLGGAGGVADGARVAVVGGSHGGFLASHLIGQVRVDALAHRRATSICFLFNVCPYLFLSTRTCLKSPACATR